jgi:hypothetical protein
MLASVRQPDGARVAYSGQPSVFEKTRQQGGPECAADVVMLLGPVKALVSKGASGPAQRSYVNVEAAQQLFASGRDSKLVLLVTERTQVQQAVSQRNGEYACQVVVARSRDSYFRYVHLPGFVRQSSECFDSSRHVRVLEPKQPLPANLLTNNEATPNQLRQVSAGGLRGDRRGHRQLRSGVTAAVHHHHEHLNPLSLSNETGYVRERVNIHTSF